LYNLPFLSEPTVCASFSQATLNGKKVVLSGEEPFKNIVLPLVKALQYKISIDQSLTRFVIPHPTLVLCACVVDAPMLLVEAPKKATDPILSPWVRVMRFQAKPDPTRGTHEYFGIDFVHIDAVEQYISSSLGPFATEFSRRATRLEEVWKNGGIVDTMDSVQWDQIQPRPQRG
jgi:hypothetical protein